MKSCNRTPNLKDGEWRRHASDCPECRQALTVTEWMTGFAAATPAPQHLPSPGFLLAKSRIRQRLAAADLVNRPLNAMSALAGLLIVISVVGFGTGTRVGSVMIGAVSLVSSFAPFIVVGIAIVTIVYAAAAYFENRDSA